MFLTGCSITLGKLSRKKMAAQDELADLTMYVPPTMIPVYSVDYCSSSI